MGHFEKVPHPLEWRQRLVAEAGVEALVDLAHVLVDHLEGEVLLVLEVMIERALRGVGSLKQGLDPKVMVAVLQQHGLPGIEQALLGRVGRLRQGSAFDLFDHVIDDEAVFPLGAEHDEFRIGLDLDVMAGGPIEQVVGIHRLRGALGIGRGDPAFEDERLRTIFQYFSIDPKEMEKELHSYAKELLAAKKVPAAWQVLISLQ